MRRRQGFLFPNQKVTRPQPWFLVFLLGLLAFPAHAEVPPAMPRTGDLLTVEECIAVAVSQHPDFQVYRSEIEASQARLGQAEADYLPVLDLGLAFQRDWEGDVHGRNAVGLPYSTIREGEDYLGFVAVRWTLFDFGGRRSRATAGRENVSAARWDYDTAASAVVFDVKVAYYGVVKARRIRDAEVESVKKFEQHLAQARSFFAAGKKPRYDVTKAELDLSSEKLKLIVAESDLRLAWVALNRVLGLYSQQEYRIVDAIEYRKYEITVDVALERSYKNRPDLQGLLARASAAENLVSSARAESYPTLSGNGSYVYNGKSLPMDNGWSAGVTVSLNLFNGLRTKNRVSEASANVQALAARVASLKLEIASDITSGSENLRQAEESIANTELMIRLAQENLEIANLRYESGIGSPVEVTDAVVAQSAADTAHIRALYDYKIAQAFLEKAMGDRP
jgi:outer membrane protein